jgi:hypothetical protein
MVLDQIIVDLMVLQQMVLDKMALDKICYLPKWYLAKFPVDGIAQRPCLSKQEMTKAMAFFHFGLNCKSPNPQPRACALKHFTTVASFNVTRAQCYKTFYDRKLLILYKARLFVIIR